MDPDATVSPAPDGGGDEVPETYAFESRFVAGESSVAYTGQTFRHVLIAELSAYVERLTDEIDTGATPADGVVYAALDFYYQFDPTIGSEVGLTLSTTPPPLQATYGDLSATGANLKSKVAGAETDIDHRDWSTEFRGWTQVGATSPDALVQIWFLRLDELAYDRGRGIVPTEPGGAAIGKVYVTPEGQDLKQLLQKFLLMSIAYHQATDKYLDSATDGKGLLAANARDADKPYTVLEHAWDEGFGYFGANRAYKLHTDAENASPGHFDANQDGAIDLKSEHNFGASVNAVKRDLGSVAPTDFSGAAIDAFLAGRALIARAPGELTPDELAELEVHRDVAVANWELAIAATIVHYINDVIREMDAFGTPDYAFLDHAKAWSELKGFALGLQFNPRSPMTSDQFAELHAYLGDAPALSNAAPSEIADYRAALLAARDLLQQVYGFDAANMGDMNGEGGW